MKNRLNKNKRIAVAAGVVVVGLVGLAVAVYIINNDKTGVENPGAYYGQDADGFSVSVDEDGRRGTSQVVGVDQIREGFGADVTVSEPKESGVVRLGAVLAETASFPVVTPQGAVTFEVDTRIYESDDDLERAASFTGAEETPVEGVGSEAHYLVPFGQERLGEQRVALIVVEGKTSYSFAIVQQTEGMVYDEQTAKDIVLAVARQANLGAVK